MSLFYRVFGTTQTVPEPAALLKLLRDQDSEARGHFRGDDQGWFAADLVLASDEAPLRLERFLSTEEGIRAELNTWAAWLETATQEPNQAWLMQHVIQTTQIFTLELANPDSVDRLHEECCVRLCQYLARATEGIYQVDTKGFFTAEGTLLVREES